MTATVYFTDFKANSKENLPEKLARLITTAGLGEVLEKNDLTGVKLHFGEKGNTAFIRPPFIRRIVQAIRETGAIPFLTDANTLYAGTRSDTVSHITTAVANGFSFSSMDNAPIVIADGLRGKSETAIRVALKHCKDVYIGSEIVGADALISVAHFKGHELSGFGGTLKNLGMGCASRKGKLDQHSTVSPKIKKKFCIGCGECADNCPAEAITLAEEKAAIDPDRCIGCGECIIRCPTGAVNIRWNQTVPVFLEKMMEYTKGVLLDKEDKALFINFITDISPACDCLPYNDSPIVRDIGIVVSTDPVAIDQASADLVNAEKALPGTCLKHNTQAGEDKFKGLYPDVDWEIQLDYAETIELGTRKYELVKLNSLTWK
ncbi:MAG: DUF362 domain-containing protein [Desulfobacteraceae bacterium]|nr:DUF362 domain-containing protein [Desulfobacteraceae bacterium]